MRGAAFADEAGSEPFKNTVGLEQRFPEAVRIIRIIGGMNGIASGISEGCSSITTWTAALPSSTITISKKSATVRGLRAKRLALTVQKKYWP